MSKAEKIEMAEDLWWEMAKEYRGILKYKTQVVLAIVRGIEEWERRRRT